MIERQSSVAIAERGGKVALGHAAAFAQLFEERAKSDGSSWMHGAGDIRANA